MKDGCAARKMSFCAEEDDTCEKKAFRKAISPKYNILACGIRKSMSQLLINIMCLLNNEQEFQRQNRSLNETWMSGRVCSHDDPKFHISQKSVLNSRNLTKFAFIRDPFDRFISFYLHICQNENGCWDCGGDMRCVLKNVYESLKKYEEDPDESKSTLVDRHAAPISWNCNFQEHISTYNLIKISTDAENRQSAIGELSALLADREISAHLITMISNGSLC
uniref:Sulfotransferase domain-containing protein n=1 Tax=Caenorhabditis japonica TaxID=281687 RepID=A0A8R1HS74_CAEJA